VRNFLADLRYALRLLRKSPGFSLIVILVLALGIGANSAVFSIVDAVLLRKLPYREPDRLVMIWEKNPTLGAFIGDRVPAALNNFREWQKRSTQFEGIGGFEVADLNLTSGSEPERIEGARASANFFEVLGVQPRLGTNFQFAETDPDRSRVAVLSDAFFKTHFGGNGNALGQRLTLNDVDYTIVGVLPPEFHLPASREGVNQARPLIWIPYDGTEKNNDAEFHRRKMQVYGRLGNKMFATGRIRPIGGSILQARSEMDGIAKQLAVEDPTQNAGFGANVFPLDVEDVGKDLRRNLLVLLAAVGFVLLIACANIANLMLTRATARQKEMAIRKALGASRGRLISQMLAESLLLGGTGAALGLALAHYGIKALVALQPAGINRPEEIQLGVAVVIFTMMISILAALIFGMVPALQAARTDVSASLNQTRGAYASTSGRLRKVLIVSEVALACVLLVGAGFMIKSLVAAWHVDPGFRADHLLTMNFSLPQSRYASNERIAAFCRQALEKISTTPGVTSASFSDGLPLTRLRMTKFTVEGQPEPARGSEPTADMRGIFNPSYFDAVGIRILSGRNFTEDELRNKRPVVIVNQTLAKKLWPNQETIGKHLRSVPSKSNPQPIVSTVIGVVADTHQVSLEEGTRPEVTKPMPDYTHLTLAVRSRENAEAMIARVKNQIWAVDRNLPVYEVQTMEQVVAQSTSERRFESFLMSIFAALALALAAIGIYGVLSSLVTQRTQEIGVRMALGAQMSDILRMILSEGLRLVMLGVVIGVGAGIALSRYLSSLFFAVSPANPATYVEVSFLVLGVALIACYFPASRAARVNPMIALRYE
jgi:putative ABC transport system permease protein